MLCGRCSMAQRSLLVLFPSTWCAAVAHPHRNLSGKALPLSGVTDAPLAAWANDSFPIPPSTIAAEALRNSSRREISFVAGPATGRHSSLISITLLPSLAHHDP